MILFKKIRFKNFLSYGSIFTELELNKEPITAILGNTGHGKSSITDAICFALFGKPFRKINKPKLISYKNKRELVCEIEFEVNQKEYMVRRGLKPDIFEIYENNELINQSAAIKDYQAYLENNILGYSYSIFTQVVILSLSAYTPFIRLTSDSRRKFVETILGLDIFSTMNDIHKQNISETKNKLSDIKTDIAITQEKIRLTENYIKKLETDRDNNKLEQEEKIKTLAKEIKQKLDVIDKELLEKQKSFIQYSNEELISFKTKLEQINSLLAKSDLQLNKLQKDKSFYITNPDTCPSCKQSITPDFKNSILEQVNKKVSDIDIAKSKITNNINNINAKLIELNEISQKNRDIQNAINILESKKHDLKTQILELKKQKTKLDEKDLDKINDEYDNLEKLHNSYKSLLDFKEELLITQEYNDVILNMLKDSGIKKSIIHQYIGIINNLINAHLDEIGFYVRVVLDEEFNDTFYVNGINEVDYGGFSEGQKLLIDLAIILTWRDIAKIRTGVDTNLFFIDDIILRLDAEYKAAVIELLNNRKNMNPFIVNPPDNIVIENIPSIITVNMLNGYSQLNY